MMECVSSPNFIGSHVRVKVKGFDQDDSDQDDSDEEFEGFVQNVVNLKENNYLVVLRNCKNFEGKDMPGIQSHDTKSIKELNVLKEGDGRKASPPTSSGLSFRGGPTNGHSNGRPMGQQKHFRNDNHHLSKLHPVQMTELVSQLQFEKPPKLERLLLEPERPWKIVLPEQDVYHMEGERFKDRFYNEFGVVRDRLWKDGNTPLALSAFPSRWYYITASAEDREARRLALDDLARQPVVGVSLQGQALCRKGNLSTISFSTSESVFTFDIVELGADIFDEGLRDILQSSKCLKVFHNCRQASDLLKHRYDVTLQTVYDTQAAHSVVLTRDYCGGYMPKYTVSVAHMARAYFGIKTTSLFFPHYRMKYVEEDTAIWMKRPLTPELEFGVLYDVAYLLDLHKATMDAILSPMYDVTKILLSDLRDADEVTNGGRSFESNFQLPTAAIEALPRWEPNERVASRVGVLDGKFVHQVVGQIDPTLIFSRDVMHQNKVLRK